MLREQLHLTLNRKPAPNPAGELGRLSKACRIKGTEMGILETVVAAAKKETAAQLKAPKDPTTTWVSITPELAAEFLSRNTLNRPKKPSKIKLYSESMAELAAEFLSRNTLNRPKKPSKIKLYSESMAAGQWPVTGVPIIFGRGGRLLDGQNRLQAIIDTGSTVRTLVVEGVEDEVFDVIDSGARRSSSDVLVIMGYEGWIASCGSSAVTVASNLMRGLWPYTNTVSPQGVREFVECHPDLMRSVEFMSGFPRKGVTINHSAGAALHFLMAKKSAVLADRYMQQLYIGNDLCFGDMVLTLRNSIEAKGKVGEFNDRSGKTLLVGAIIRVWNSLRSGRSIKHAGNMYPRASEKFPVIE